MTRSERIAAHIANRITKNRTRKGFSALYAEALEKEYEMLDRKSNLVPDSHGNPQPGGIAHEIKQTDHSSIVGSNKGDHRQEAEHVQMPPQPAPREPKGQSQVGPR